MAILIDRFEAKQRDESRSEVMFKAKSGAIVKDHKTDVVIAYINFENNVEENLELASRIITTIETYIEERENGAENQNG